MINNANIEEMLRRSFGKPLTQRDVLTEAANALDEWITKEGEHCDLCDAFIDPNDDYELPTPTASDDWQQICMSCANRITGKGKQSPPPLPSKRRR